MSTPVLRMSSGSVIEIWPFSLEKQFEEIHKFGGNGIESATQVPLHAFVQFADDLLQVIRRLVEIVRLGLKKRWRLAASSYS